MSSNQDIIYFAVYNLTHVLILELLNKNYIFFSDRLTFVPNTTHITSFSHGQRKTQKM